MAGTFLAVWWCRKKEETGSSMKGRHRNRTGSLPSRTGEGASACRFPHCGPTAVSAPAPVHGKDSTVIIGLISRFLWLLFDLKFSIKQTSGQAYAADAEQQLLKKFSTYLLGWGKWRKKQSFQWLFCWSYSSPWYGIRFQKQYKRTLKWVIFPIGWWQYIEKKNDLFERKIAEKFNRKKDF